MNAVHTYIRTMRTGYTVQSSYADENNLDLEGKPKRKPRRKGPFIELAAEHGLASPDTADRTYRKALQKMHQKLSK